MKLLVTGGAGFIGSNLVKSLADLGHKVVAVDDHSSSRKDYSSFYDNLPNVELISSCFSDDIILQRIRSKEFYAVFHVAAIPRVVFSVENPWYTTDVNVSKTVKLLEACIDSVERFIFSSSSSVYGNCDKLPLLVDQKKSPESPYAWQKSSIEDIAKTFSKLYSLDICSLRYFNVFGPGQFGDSAYSTAISAWCHAVKNNQKLRKDGTGEQSRDMCYVGNVVDANVLALEFPGEFSGQCFNICCGESVTNNEILSFFKQKFPDIEIQNAPFRPGDVMHTLGDISESQNVLGYSPKTKFWDGLEKTLEWWKLSNE